MLEYLPPRVERAVTIDGYAVPKVEAREINTGLMTDICLDGRFGIQIPAEYASSVIWLIANAMAIGAGYSCHGKNSSAVNPFQVAVSEITTTEAPHGRD